MNKVILLVDDDDSLSQFIKICLDETGSQMDLKQVTTTDKALEYLANQGEFSDRNQNPEPAFMLLDLGLPKVSGIDFLKTIKNSKTYSGLPVVILTAMESSSVIAAVNNNYANSCLIKPFGYEKTRELMKRVTTYWGKYNKLPDRAD